MGLHSIGSLRFTDSLSFLLSPDVNFDELARCTDDYNGAMLKAVCVEAVSIQCFLGSPLVCVFVVIIMVAKRGSI